MTLELILLILGFLLVVFLIFKFIKKVFVAVVSLILFVVLIFAGVVGLVYMDYNYVANQDDYTVNMVYVEGNEYLFGITFPVIENKLDLDQVQSLSGEELENLDPEELEAGDKQYAILIDAGLFAQIIEDDSFVIAEIGGDNVSLDSEGILEVINSEDPEDTFFEVVVESAQEVEEQDVEEYLEDINLGPKEAVFLVALNESLSDEENALRIAEGFKEDELQIYPERYTFKLFKFLIPTETIRSFISEDLPEETSENQ